MPATLADWIESYRLAWERRDPEAAAQLFTPDATYRDQITEPPHTGHDGVRAYWTSVTATQEDVRVRMGGPFVDGSRVAVEFWTTMRAEGDPVTLAGCLLLDFDDHWLCRRLREYWTVLDGFREPPEEWGR